MRRIENDSLTKRTILGKRANVTVIVKIFIVIIVLTCSSTYGESRHGRSYNDSYHFVNQKFASKGRVFLLVKSLFFILIGRCNKTKSERKNQAN